MSSLYQFVVKTIDGKSQSLSDFKGRVLLIVNTASECGFTLQYAQLQALYERYQADGLTILAFPCNQFGQQEPGSNAQIAHFCDSTFHVTFPLMAKVDVKGAQIEPLFAYLIQAAPGLLGTRAIKWNFTKFLINRQGEVVQRFASASDFQKLEVQIQHLLAQPS